MMDIVKASLLFIGAIFFFATGIYFHSSFSSQKRELASISAMREPNSADNARASSALRNCLSENVKDSRLNLTKATVDGRRWSIVTMVCTGNRAQELYNAVAPYSTEEYVRFRSGSRGVGRFFGRLYPPSQCVELLYNRKGAAVKSYSCSIRVDLDHELTEGLRL